MSEMLKKYGGLILFYGIIIVSVILLNERCRYLKEQQKIQNNTTMIEMAIQNKGGKENV